MRRTLRDGAPGPLQGPVLVVDTYAMTERTCLQCGAANRADSQWCGRCLAPFDRPVAPAPYIPAPPGPPTAPARYPVGKGRNYARMIRVGVAIAVLLVGGRSASRALERTPEPVASAADPRGFKFLALDGETGDPLRYNPCDPIHYVVTSSNLPAGGVGAVQRAVRYASKATGIEFAYDGLTDEEPSPDRDAFQPDRYGDRWAPVVIGWLSGDPGIFPERALGYGGSEYRANGDGELAYVTGLVALNGGAAFRLDSGPGDTWEKVILHELGHVLGLDHVQNHGQMMNDAHIPAVSTWGYGDREGLRRLGPASGCLDPPVPG